MTPLPDFLTVEEVLDIHRDQIEKYGGSMGVRDMGLLDSAVKAPMATYGGEFLNADLFEMAAALLYSLVNNHAFVDGNKRAGTAAALVFLEINDIVIASQEPEFGDLVLGVATGEKTKDNVADYFRSHQA